MSRIGHKVINIPAGTTVEVNGNTVVVKGPKGTESATFNPLFTYEINGSELTVKRPNDEKQTKALHGKQHDRWRFRRIQEGTCNRWYWLQSSNERYRFIIIYRLLTRCNYYS